MSVWPHPTWCWSCHKSFLLSTMIQEPFDALHMHVQKAHEAWDLWNGVIGHSRDLATLNHVCSSNRVRYWSLSNDKCKRIHLCLWFAHTFIYSFFRSYFRLSCLINKELSCLPSFIFPHMSQITIFTSLFSHTLFFLTCERIHIWIMFFHP